MLGPKALPRAGYKAQRIETLRKLGIAELFLAQQQNVSGCPFVVLIGVRLRYALVSLFLGSGRREVGRGAKLRTLR